MGIYGKWGKIRMIGVFEMCFWVGNFKIKNNEEKYYILIFLIILGKSIDLY